jgi:hypothetical protein
LTIQLESSRDQIRRLQGEIDKLTNPKILGSDPENTGLNLQSNPGLNLQSNSGSNLGSDPENTGLNLQSNPGSNLGSDPEITGLNLQSNSGSNVGSNLGSNLGSDPENIGLILQSNPGSNLGSNHGSYPYDPESDPDDPKNLETEIQSLNILLELRDDKMREQSDKLKDLTSR